MPAFPLAVGEFCRSDPRQRAPRERSLKEGRQQAVERELCIALCKRSFVVLAFLPRAHGRFVKCVFPAADLKYALMKVFSERVKKIELFRFGEEPHNIHEVGIEFGNGRRDHARIAPLYFRSFSSVVSPPCPAYTS